MEIIKKKTKIDSLIEKRDRYTSDINRYWSIINTENIIKKGYIRNYDLKEVLKTIYRLYEEQVKVKLCIQCANMGIKMKDLPADANVINIYKFAAIKEYNIRLGFIKTIDPVKKAKKGKKGLPITEALTHNFIKARQAEVTLLINELDKKIKNFNSSIEVDEDEAPMYLAA